MQISNFRFLGVGLLNPAIRTNLFVQYVRHSKNILSKEGGTRGYELCNYTNDKLTRVDAQGSYIHNDRRSKGHSNKDIDPTRTHLNFYCKKNELTYIKEFDKMKKEYDLKGTIRSNSIIMCEMMITSDNAFLIKLVQKKLKDISKRVISSFVIIIILEKEI